MLIGAVGLPQAPSSSVLASVPMTVLANAPYIEATMNGRGPFTFEVDTGSMTSPLAREEAQEMGFSAGSSAHTATFGVGGLRLPIPTSFASFEGLGALPGRRIYGDVGYGVLRHYVVEIDYARGRLTIHDPARFVYHGSGTVFPASLEMDYDPQIDGVLDVKGLAPIPVRLTLDTGAGGTVVSSPIVRQHHLVEHATAVVPSLRRKALADGVNGAVFDTVTARIEQLQIGPYVFDRPLVALSRDTDGTFAMDDIGVNLGGNVLRRFTVIVDYPHRRVILEPNEHLHDPFLADASGLVLTTVGGTMHAFMIHGIVPGSAAAEAGCRDGDEITAIDGRPAREYALWQVQDLLREAPQARRLTLRRRGRTVNVELKLRPLA